MLPTTFNMTPQVIFKEDTHQYFNSTGEEYISCTTLINKFVPKFDVDKYASLVGRRDGKTSDQIKDVWKQNSKQSTDFGTLIHKGIEGYIKNIPDYYNNEWKEDCKNGYNNIIQTIGNNNLNSEVLFWNHEYKIAGQSDIVQYNTNLKNKYTGELYPNYANIGDIKTNKEFTFESKYHEYLLKPLNHLMACKYNEYALQLSLYAYMIQTMYPDYQIGKLFINHFNSKTKHWTIIPIPYMKHEVLVMLKYFKK